MTLLALNEQQVRRLRLRANGLAGGHGEATDAQPRHSERSEESLRRSEESAGPVAAVARRLVGVQAQDRAAAELAWQPRSTGLTREDVAAAVDGAPGKLPALVRTWAMRGTLHLMAADDVPWLLALLGPPFVQKGKRRRKQLGLNEAICARATALLRDLLTAAKALTRAQVGQALAAGGIPVDGQAIYHLLYRAGLEGLICFGPGRDGEHTFVLLQDWLGDDVSGAALPPPQAMARLARRYLQGYGPVTVADFARWSGLGLRASRRALQELHPRLQEAQNEAGETLFLLEEQAAWLDEPEMNERPVRFLPAYDSFLLGYESRAFIVSEDHARRIHPGGGVIHPTVLVNGRAAGNWHLRQKPGEVDVDVTFFEDSHDVEAEGVAAAVQEMRRFVSGAAT